MAHHLKYTYSEAANNSDDDFMVGFKVVDEWDDESKLQQKKRRNENVKKTISVKRQRSRRSRSTSASSTEYFSSQKSFSRSRDKPSRSQSGGTPPLPNPNLSNKAMKGMQNPQDKWTSSGLVPPGTHMDIKLKEIQRSEDISLNFDLSTNVTSSRKENKILENNLSFQSQSFSPEKQTNKPKLTAQARKKQHDENKQKDFLEELVDKLDKNEKQRTSKSNQFINSSPIKVHVARTSMPFQSLRLNPRQIQMLQPGPTNRFDRNSNINQQNYMMQSQAGSPNFLYQQSNFNQQNPTMSFPPRPQNNFNQPHNFHQQNLMPPQPGPPSRFGSAYNFNQQNPRLSQPGPPNSFGPSSGFNQPNPMMIHQPRPQTFNQQNLMPFQPVPSNRFEPPSNLNQPNSIIHQTGPPNRFGPPNFNQQNPMTLPQAGRPNNFGQPTNFNQQNPIILPQAGPTNSFGQSTNPMILSQTGPPNNLGQPNNFNQQNQIFEPRNSAGSSIMPALGQEHIIRPFQPGMGPGLLPSKPGLNQNQELHTNVTNQTSKSIETLGTNRTLISIPFAKPNNANLNQQIQVNFLNQMPISTFATRPAQQSRFTGPLVTGILHSVPQAVPAPNYDETFFIGGRPLFPILNKNDMEARTMPTSLILSNSRQPPFSNVTIECEREDQTKLPEISQAVMSSKQFSTTMSHSAGKSSTVLTTEDVIHIKEEPVFEMEDIEIKKSPSMAMDYSDSMFVDDYVQSIAPKPERCRPLLTVKSLNILQGPPERKNTTPSPPPPQIHQLKQSITTNPHMGKWNTKVAQQPILIQFKNLVHKRKETTVEERHTMNSPEIEEFCPPPPILSEEPSFLEPLRTPPPPPPPIISNCLEQNSKRKRRRRRPPPKKFH